MQQVSSILWLLQGYLWFCDVKNRVLLFGYWGNITLTIWITVCLWYTKTVLRCCTCSLSFLDLKLALWSKQRCVQCQVFAYSCARKHPRHQSAVLNLWPRTGCSVLAPLSACLLYFNCGQLLWATKPSFYLCLLGSVFTERESTFTEAILRFHPLLTLFYFI